MQRTYVILAAIFALPFCIIQPALAQNNVMLIIDASGSMKEKVDGKTRISVAKNVVGDAIGKLPADTNLGLMVYGHRRSKDCTDLELMSPIGAEDAATISGLVNKLDAKGETPIAEALIKAAKSFKVFKGQQNQIILVTDGLEECKGDPCAAAQSLKDAGLDVAVNIVGFTLDDEKAKQLQCVTDLTGGTYYSAANTEALTQAMQDVQKHVEETVIVEAAKPKTFNGDLLAAENGGTLIYAPNDAWNALNKPTIELKSPTYNGAAVWAFKDGKVATLKQIEVFVPKASKYNLKDFEVLAADALDGPFRSLGEFSVKNVKMMPEGWQGFTFPETTARFVKVVFKTSQSGEYISGNALKLIGTLDEASEPADLSSAPKGTDLIAASHGGMFYYGSNDEWQKLNQGKAEGALVRVGEGVWAFKDEAAATLSAVQILIPKAFKYNLKDFEILVGHDGPTDDFQSVGTFSVNNVRVMPDGWQTFTLPKTPAKYIKLKTISSQSDGYIAMHGFRVIGELTPTVTE